MLSATTAIIRHATYHAHSRVQMSKFADTTAILFTPVDCRQNCQNLYFYSL